MLFHALTLLEVHEYAPNNRIASASNTGPLSQPEISERYRSEDINPVRIGVEEPVVCVDMEWHQERQG